MSWSLKRLATAVVLVLGASLAPLAVAEADVPRATNGLRCTIVGSSGADRLVGTAGRDVICGRGGHDRIFGHGGNDVVDGGPGRDRLHGGNGADLLIAGGGHDVLYGAAGHDRLLGGDGNDRISGGGGADRLRGGAGDDQLDGDRGVDELAGGAGRDVCVPRTGDAMRSCLRDTAGPRVHWVSLGRTEVDVTSEATTVTLRLRVSDWARTDMFWLTLSGGNHGDWVRPAGPVLVSGNARDGVWRTRIRIPRGFPDGVLRADLTVWDSLDNRRDWTRRTALTVRDAAPDTEFPQVDLLTPTPTTEVDTRPGPRSVLVRMHITDVDTGVQPDQVSASIQNAERIRAGYGDGPSAPARLVSGTLHDGTWEARIPLPEHSPGGDWTVHVRTTDRARPYAAPSHWYGPDQAQYATVTDDPRFGQNNRLPRGWGRFSVHGEGDSTPPDVTQARADATVVDLTTVDHRYVHLSMRADDRGQGTRQVTTRFVGPGGRLTAFDARYSPDAEGLWHGNNLLTSDLPSGTYYVVIGVTDGRNTRVWTSSPDYHSEDPSVIRDAGLPKLTVLSRG